MEERPELRRLPRGMRDEVVGILEPGETILATWATRGIGANALICTSTRALIAKRAELIRWAVAEFPYTEIAAVELLDGRPGAATELVLVPPTSEPAARPGPFDDFPDAYFQESRRLIAPNTLVLRSRRRADEAADLLRSLIAESRSS